MEADGLGLATGGCADRAPCVPVSGIVAQPDLAPAVGSLWPKRSRCLPSRPQSLGGRTAPRRFPRGRPRSSDARRLSKQAWTHAAAVHGALRAAAEYDKHAAIAIGVFEQRQLQPMWQDVAMPACAEGASMVVMGGFRPGRFREAVARRRTFVQEQGRGRKRMPVAASRTPALGQEVAVSGPSFTRAVRPPRAPLAARSAQRVQEGSRHAHGPGCWRRCREERGL